MAILTITNGESTNLAVVKVTPIEYECFTLYEYIVNTNQGDNISIELEGNHFQAKYILAGNEQSFSDTANVVFNTSLRIRFLLLNSGQTGIFTNATITITNITTSNYYENFVERQNDNSNCFESDNTFLGLNDTPSSYSGQQGKFVKVNMTENALEFSSTINQLPRIFSYFQPSLGISRNDITPQFYRNGTNSTTVNFNQATGITNHLLLNTIINDNSVMCNAPFNCRLDMFMGNINNMGWEVSIWATENFNPSTSGGYINEIYYKNLGTNSETNEININSPLINKGDFIHVFIKLNGGGNAGEFFMHFKEEL